MMQGCRVQGALYISSLWKVIYWTSFLFFKNHLCRSVILFYYIIYCAGDCRCTESELNASNMPGLPYDISVKVKGFDSAGSQQH